MRALASTVILSALMSAAATAGANGRYPSAQQLLVDPSDPARLWLRATYGLATQNEPGAPWGWVCEDAVGYGPREDPIVVMAHGGRLFASSFGGVLASSDGGCSWKVDPSLGDLIVRDLTTDGDHSHVVAVTSTPLDNGDYELRLWRSAGEPPVFAPVGPPFSHDLLAFTVDVAPSDPDRVYVSTAMWPLAPSADAGPPVYPTDGSTQSPNAPAFLLRSRDGGVTWERLRLRGASLYSNPYIAAVSPTNPDVLYVRVQGPSVAGGFVSSHLLYSDDAGDSFREVFRGPADMLGFALSPDGERVYIGLGDSMEPGGRRPVKPDALGLYEATVPDFSFAHVFGGQIGCLTYSGETLLACGGQYSNGFEVGASTDRGRSFRPLLNFGGISGPLACPASSHMSALCAPAWPALCDPIGVCPSKQEDTDAGAEPTKPEPEPALRVTGCCGNESRKSARGMTPGAGALAVALGASLGLRRRRRR